MARFQEVDYCSEEVKSVANPGGGMQKQIVKETFVEEVDKAGRHHGHHGRHGHGGSGHFEVRESRLEEDINTRTGEFHERKENFLVRADD
ncbi:hypothetical protein ACQ4PT_042089 [Festuca glaucescens]